MNRSLFFTLLSLGLLISSCKSKNNPDNFGTGLVGGWYHGRDLTRIGQSMALPDINPIWDVLTGRGSGWSANWEGYVIAPYNGEVTFYATCDRELRVSIENTQVLHIGGDGKETTSFMMKMKKGQAYHINLKYLQAYGGVTQFNVLWSWEDQPKAKIPTELLYYSKEQAEWWNYVEQPDPEKFDWSTINQVNVGNGFVYSENGKFAGWPANHGIWNWGDEILVGFEIGTFDENVSGGHSYRSDLPQESVLARSLDGGKSWQVERPLNYVNSSADSPEKVKTLTTPINFSHPELVLRVRNDRFYVSYDKGNTWAGIHKMNIKSPEVEGKKRTSRTDYIPISKNECLFFLSLETGVVDADYQDRAFCAVTKDGGLSFEFLGWITADTDKRSVMTATKMLEKDHFITVLRRKFEKFDEERPSFITNWVEAAESVDGGKTWKNLGKVAQTDLGERNGNPPALVKLDDGRLCTIYGYREFPYGIRMKVSEDNGKTWGKEYSLRTDGATWDLGYPRAVINSEGKIVVTYYYTTQDNFAQFIGVTTIDPKDF